MVSDNWCRREAIVFSNDSTFLSKLHSLDEGADEADAELRWDEPLNCSLSQ